MEYLQLFMPLLVAALAGGLIGIEREYRDKSAGFRTMILIAIGSALFTTMSITIAGKNAEATRIAAAIVSGVGFLGAGAILKNGLTIHGLTTAASIWTVASLGMAAGAGQYILVAMTTALVLPVLWLLPYLERIIDRWHEFVEVTVTIKNADDQEDNILDIFDEQGITVAEISRSRSTKTERTVMIKAKMNASKRAALSEILVNETGVLAFTA